MWVLLIFIGMANSMNITSSQPTNVKVGGIYTDLSICQSNKARYNNGSDSAACVQVN